MFWVFFYIISILFWSLSIKTKYNDQKKLIRTYVIFLWFIGSFRYMVGADYYSYRLLYDIPVDKIEDVFSARTEPMFQLIVMILNDLGFDFQMMFLIYETLIIYFFLKGIRCFFINDRYVLLTLIIYGCFSIGFYWSLNVIRQVLAMSICFYSVKFIISRDIYKFIVCIIIAVLNHYSAIIFLPMYILYGRRLNFRFCIISLLFFILLTISGKNIDIILLVLSFVSDNYGYYTGYAMNIKNMIVIDSSIPSSTIVLVAVYFYMMYELRGRNDNSIEMCISMTYLYFILRVFATFNDVSGFNIVAIANRIPHYWSYFFIVLIVYWFEEMKNPSRRLIYTTILLIVLSAQNLVALEYNAEKSSPIITPDGPLIDFEYDINFKLLK